MRILIAALFVLTTSTIFSQTYSYGFNGAIDSEQRTRLENSCTALPDVKSCKIRYKEADYKGELIIVISPIVKEGEEGRESFSPIDVKRILLDQGLQPLEFRSIDK